jgi:hypothetical protein
MVDQKDVRYWIQRARAAGATVTVEMDQQALKTEGREIICTVQVSGLEGVGPYPMTESGAVERLRAVLPP